jgi:hypothetical protein
VDNLSLTTNASQKGGMRWKSSLFASQVNAQLSRFVSWKPDPDACLFNAFSVSWRSFTPYVFPSFSLLGKYWPRFNRTICLRQLWSPCVGQRALGIQHFCLCSFKPQLCSHVNKIF